MGTYPSLSLAGFGVDYNPHLNVLPGPPHPMQHIDGINLFGLISIASLLFCLPAALVLESSLWGPAWQAASTKAGQQATLQLLLGGGLFYHLYNQVSGEFGHVGRDSRGGKIARWTIPGDAGNTRPQMRANQLGRHR